MFRNPRYLTTGVSETIPILIQLCLWDFAADMEDHLQIFELSPDGKKQRIIHKQEQPEYRKEYLVPCSEPVTAKVYIIDDETHSTMLLAEEY